MCNGQQCKRDDLRSIHGSSIRRAKTEAHGTGIGFKFAAAKLGEVLPHRAISPRPAAEFHAQRDEILKPPLIREPLPNSDKPLGRFNSVLEDVTDGLRSAVVYDREQHLLFVVEIGIEGAAGIPRRLADLID